jgi:hypothetical protein
MSDNFVNQGEDGVIVPKQLIRQVRRIIQDYPEVNEIFEGEETSDMQLGRFLVDMVDDWNYTPPLTQSAMINAVSLVKSPSLGGARKWIVDATAARAMKSVLMKLARNDMPYTAGNVTIQPNSVWRNLQPIIQDIEIQYREFRDRYKISKNSESAYGVTHSELYMGNYDQRDGYLVVTY